MERTFLFWFVSFATLFFVSGHGTAQEEPAFREITANSVRSLLEQGAEYERDEQWGEALTHYEEAIREFPDDAKLERRLQISRIHYDLDRRYVDKSYLSLIATMQQPTAMELLTEVLLKIDSHYVERPDWNSLIRTGTTAASIALRDVEFQRQNRIKVSHEQIRRTIQIIWNAQARRDFRSRQQAQDFIQWCAQTIHRQTGLRTGSALFEYISGTMSSLDTYSAYLTGDQLDELYSQIEGNFVGLGIELKPVKGALLIANVIKNGPAFRSGIQRGDRIVEVDGKSTTEVSTDKAADMLKGEQGSYVQVAVLARDGRLRRYYIRRERVEVPSVEDVKMLDAEAGIAYFKISSFQKTTAEDVGTALWKLHRQGMRKLIVDVRGNPGGLLPKSVEVADYFIKEGTIVRTRGRSSRENFSYKARLRETWRVPLVVLIDGDSASASEIFAGAIRDHGRGTIVGTRSYGKGSVQGIFPLRTVKSGIRLTTAKFYSPSDQEISRNGIEPNIEVNGQVVAKPVDDGGLLGDERDFILEAGTEVARNHLARDRRIPADR